MARLPRKKTRLTPVCRTCGGTIFDDKTITVTQTYQGSAVMVENVPATACRQCGESLLSGEVAAVVQELVRAERPPDRTKQAWVYDFPSKQASERNAH